MAGDGLVYGERKFGQTYAIRIMLAMLLLGPLLLAWTAIEKPNPSSHPVLLWISVVVVACYIVLWVAISRTVLTITDQGIRRESILGQQEIQWSHISETRYLVRPIRIGAHFGLIGALVSAASSKSSSVNLVLTLIGSDGKRLKVTSNFQKAKEAIGIVFGKVLPPMVAAARTKIQHGETVAFGDLALTVTNVTWKGGPPIPVSEITGAEIAGTNLRLKRAGKWLSAVTVRSDKIPNVLVFLEVLESVAPQSRSVEIDPLARVRI
jgi:hypothetical protein